MPEIGKLDIAHGGVMYAYPDYVAAGAKVNVQLGIFVFDGSLGAQMNVRTRQFEADLSAHICLRGVKIACAGGLGIVSSKGVVACLNIGPFHPGVGLKTNLKYEVWLFDGCKPSHYWVRNIASARDAKSSAAGLSFQLARGETIKNLRLDGQGGAPKVLVTGPGGQSLSLSADGLTHSGSLLGLRADEFGATFIGIDHGKPGRYTITALPGSVPLGALAETRPGYDTHFTARVAGRGTHLTLHYDARKRGGGQQVTFYEDGKNVMHALGSSSGGRGTLRFTPAAGAGGIRTIVARATVDGSPIRDQVIARFRFAGTHRTGSPRRVTARRRGGTLIHQLEPRSRCRQLRDRRQPQWRRAAAVHAQRAPSLVDDREVPADRRRTGHGQRARAPRRLGHGAPQPAVQGDAGGANDVPSAASQSATQAQAPLTSLQSVHGAPAVPLPPERAQEHARDERNTRGVRAVGQVAPVRAERIAATPLTAIAGPFACNPRTARRTSVPGSALRARSRRGR